MGRSRGFRAVGEERGMKRQSGLSGKKPQAQRGFGAKCMRMQTVGSGRPGFEPPGRSLQLSDVGQVTYLLQPQFPHC